MVLHLCCVITVEINAKLWTWHRALSWGGEGGELGDFGLRWRQEVRAEQR